jgi:hypothetical protein
VISAAGKKIREGHEPNKVRTLVVIWFAVGLVICVALCQVGVIGFQYFLGRRHPGEGPTHPGNTEGFSSAKNWLTPQQDLADLRAREDERLYTSGWIDRRNGIAHISIDRAMKLYAERAARPADSGQASHTTGPESQASP